MCIYAFKEAVLKYRSLNSNVYSCFLDASKAFDRVNHYVLFDKPLKRGVPLYVVRILIFWYTSQTMYVRWNNVISSGFGVSNGVRQGGILSPYLFCVYMDDLSIKLNDIKVGCTIGTTLINHLMYADDLVLLSPSAMGLSLLLSVCSAYGIEHDIKYNSAKSNVMIFRCNKMKDIRIANFELNNVLLTRVTKYKYLGHCISDANNTFFNSKFGMRISFILLQRKIITLLFALLYFMSCSMPYAEHTDSNNDKPIAEGDRSTKSSAYMRWLINVVPIVQPTFISFSLIRDNLSDDDDMARQYRQIYAQGNALLRKFVMCTESVKITLFRSFCTSLYTCELWWNYRSESLRKLCVAYNNVFRFLCGEPRNCSASHMFVSRGLPTCEMLIRKSIYGFMISTKRSCNTILQNIVGSDRIYTSPLLQHWRLLLYAHAF